MAAKKKTTTTPTSAAKKAPKAQAVEATPVAPPKAAKAAAEPKAKKLSALDAAAKVLAETGPVLVVPIRRCSNRPRLASFTDVPPAPDARIEYVRDYGPVDTVVPS
jgi:hypothetical protein